MNLVKYWDKYTELHGQENIKKNCSSSGGLYKQFTLFYRAYLWGVEDSLI